MSDPLPTVRFPLRLAEDGTVWQDDGDGLDAECIEHINDLPAEADRWRKHAERLAQAFEADWYALHNEQHNGPAEDCDVPYCVSRRNILAAHNTLAGHRAPEEEQP